MLGLAMNKAFKIIDHTADIGIVAFGTDIEQLFSNAALALSNLISYPKSVEERLQRRIETTAENLEELLVAWLNELIYYFDTEQILFSRFEIKSLSNEHLMAICYGEKLDPSRHETKVGVKAATYHMLQIDELTDAYAAQVIFDI